MLRTVTIDEDLCALLPQVRRYVGIADDSQDSILLSCLRTAIIEVQDRSDRSVCPCTMRLDIHDNADTFVPLYGSVASVISASLPDGSDVPFRRLPGGIETGAAYDTLSITYTTDPDGGERQRMLSVVFQYAAALFDGQPEEIRNILAQC